MSRCRWKSRLCVLTPDGNLLVYACLCVGHSFNLRTAKSVVVRLDCKRNSAAYRPPNCLITVRSDTGATVKLRVRGEQNVTEWSRRVLTYTTRLGASRSLFVDEKNTQTTLGINSVDRLFLDRLKYGDEEPLPNLAVLPKQAFHQPRSTRSLMLLPAEKTINVGSPSTGAPGTTAVPVPVVPNEGDRKLLPSEDECSHSIKLLAITGHSNSSTSMTSTSTEAGLRPLLSTFDDTEETAWPDPPSNLQPPFTYEWMSSERETMGEARKQFAFLSSERSEQLNESSATNHANIECVGIFCNAREKQRRRRFSRSLRKICHTAISLITNQTDYRYCN
uniref:PH domain-containing protein n=1 Tax=Plectus sambesii TaxID=2011161 RepID=A0A914ULM5_9BILA